MKTVDQMFAANKIIPVVVIEDKAAAIPLAETLLAAGINNMEITMRTDAALDIMSLISKKIPEMIIGAGTVLTAANFFSACMSGAKFIVSPGCTTELFEAARSRYNHVRFIPGVIAPSHAMEAATRGFKYLKFFPAEAFNAYQVIKALASPLPDIKFCPTGGVTIENMQKYLELPNVFGVGMSSIVDAQLIAKHDFAEIGRRAKEAVALVNKVLGI